MFMTKLCRGSLLAFYIGIDLNSIFTSIVRPEMQPFASYCEPVQRHM